MARTKLPLEEILSKVSQIQAGSVSIGQPNTQRKAYSAVQKQGKSIKIAKRARRSESQTQQPREKQRKRKERFWIANIQT